MFRRGFYLSELFPLLIALAMLGAAIYGLYTGRVPWVARDDLVTLVNYSHDPGLFWLSVSLYLLGGVTLGIISFRTLRGY
jgi:hypothetical protein